MNVFYDAKKAKQTAEREAKRAARRLKRHNRKHGRSGKAAKATKAVSGNAASPVTSDADAGGATTTDGDSGVDGGVGGGGGAVLRPGKQPIILQENKHVANLRRFVGIRGSTDDAMSTLDSGHCCCSVAGVWLLLFGCLVYKFSFLPLDRVHSTFAYHFHRNGEIGLMNSRFVADLSLICLLNCVVHPLTPVFTRCP